MIDTVVDTAGAKAWHREDDDDAAAATTNRRGSRRLRYCSCFGRRHRIIRVRGGIGIVDEVFLCRFSASAGQGNDNDIDIMKENDRLATT